MAWARAGRVSSWTTARASLLWKPVPKLPKNSVCAHGPRIALNLALGIARVALPSGWSGTPGRLFLTWKLKTSPRAPVTMRSHDRDTASNLTYGE